jgi:hypothetical protein
MTPCVLVCGGRNFTDADLLFKTLDALHAEHAFTALIHGQAQGADQLAFLWASQKGLTVTGFPAEWSKFGPSAGPRRNQEMLDIGKPDLVVAFPGGKGTKDMVRRATRAGIPVIEVAP